MRLISIPPDPPPARPRPRPSGERATPPRRLTEEFVGARLLAWAGGAALLIALGTLFWLGVRDGWIGPGARCALGAVASTALLAAGLRQARRGRAREASWAMAGTGLAGLYVTTAVAAGPYALLPALVGLALLAGLGVAAAWTALRWDAPPLAGVGLLGALAAPVLAPVDGLALPVVVLALAATGLLLRLRPWTWLTALATALALPQVAWHVALALDAAGPADGLRVAAPGAWTVAALAAGLLLTVGWELARPAIRERSAMPLLAAVHVLVAAALASGYVVIADRPLAAAATLAPIAALLVAAAAVARRRAAAVTTVELVLLGLAVLVADLGFAFVASGVVQLVGWAGSAVAFALVARRAAAGRLPVVIGGVGLHAGLGLVEVVGTLGDGGLAPLVGAALLAAACAVSARVVAPRSPGLRVALDVTALAVTALWTATALAPAELALAGAAQAAGLVLAARRDGDPVARIGGLLHLAAALALALAVGTGAAIAAAFSPVAVADLPLVVGPLAAVALAAAVSRWTLAGRRQLLAVPVAARADPAGERRLLDAIRSALALVAGVGGLLAGSGLTAALVAAAGGGDDAVAVALDALWATTAIGLVAAGLLRRVVGLRLAGLGLLAVVALKVAVLDLAAVDTAGRVVAWAVLGALLLVGAGLYGRLRPVAPPTAEQLEALERELLD